MISHQNSRFIDPENCGSSVGYYITTSEYTPKNEPVRYSLSATVILADCSHKVDWSFCAGADEDQQAGDIEKIDAAIGMLQEFKKKYVATAKTINKLNERSKNEQQHSQS